MFGRYNAIQMIHDYERWPIKANIKKIQSIRRIPSSVHICLGALSGTKEFRFIVLKPTPNLSRQQTDEKNSPTVSIPLN